MKSRLFPCQAYLFLPFILERRSTRQKETSAHWENALIIHDHLTIQDSLCGICGVSHKSVSATLVNGFFFLVQLFFFLCVSYLKIIKNKPLIWFLLNKMFLSSLKINCFMNKNMQNGTNDLCFKDQHVWIVLLFPLNRCLNRCEALFSGVFLKKFLKCGT